MTVGGGGFENLLNTLETEAVCNAWSIEFNTVELGYENILDGIQVHLGMFTFLP